MVIIAIAVIINSIFDIINRKSTNDEIDELINTINEHDESDDSDETSWLLKVI